MFEPRVTKAQEKLLRGTVIDAEDPGTILRDFQALLDRVGIEGVPAAGKHNLLPIDIIDEMDQRLSRPLRLKMKRPLLRSHPYLLGLHLLLRASGLSRVAGTGSKARLVLDPAALEQWNGLTSTERYFTLLEAWLLVGKAEMVGEQGSRFRSFLDDCLSTWHQLPPEGKTFDLKRPLEVYCYGIGRDFYHLALMDLFGLMEVTHPRQAVQPWCPAGMKHRPFGDAVFTLLWQEISLFSRKERIEAVEDDEESEEEVRFGIWQPVFQPYFPDWRNNLILPGDEPRDGVFVFRVSLGKVWRSIAISADSTLDDLVHSTLQSVDFSSDHLYEFIYRDRFGAPLRVFHPYMDEGPFADEVYIGDLPLGVGQAMQLVYDFGDNWQFTVKLERIDPPNARMKKPKILEKHGEAPEQYRNWEE